MWGHVMRWVSGRVPTAKNFVLSHGKQHHAGNSDMPKPPRGQESPSDDDTPQYVFRSKRISLIEEKLQRSASISLNRLANRFGMHKHSMTIRHLLRPHGGHHFDGMVTAVRHVFALVYKLHDVDASK